MKFAILGLAALASAIPHKIYDKRQYGQLGANDYAKRAGKLYFGTAADIPDTGELNDPYYMAQYNNTHDFGQTTPANAMKWLFREYAQNVFNFTTGDLFAKLAEENGKILRCHALVWHQQAPDYIVNGTWTKDTLLAAIDNQVRVTIAHFGDRCYAWDVVNEALFDDGTYRTSLYYNVTGTEYIATAFKAAEETVAEHKLKVKLYYNDYNIESPGAKSTAAQGIVKFLQQRNIQIDGVGMQSHFTVGGTPSAANQTANLDAFGALEVETAITELDIRTELPPTEAAKKQQAVDYQTSVSACVQSESCVGVTLWDFDDTYSWIPGVFPGEGYAHPWYQPNGTNTPLVRKIAYDGIIAGLQAPEE